MDGVDGHSFGSRLTVVGLNHKVVVDPQPLLCDQQLPLIMFLIGCSSRTIWDLMTGLCFLLMTHILKRTLCTFKDRVCKVL